MLFNDDWVPPQFERLTPDKLLPAFNAGCKLLAKKAPKQNPKKRKKANKS